METKDNVNNSKSNFFKTKGLMVLLVFFLVIFIILASFALLSSRQDEQTSKERHSTSITTTNYSIKKIVCYSSAYGVNKEETQARWDLSLSQYTDIAIYFDFQKEINSLYIDNISFSNSEENTYSLISLPIEDFGKTPSNNIEIQSTERIDFSSSSPITLRYLNQNFKENCVITDIETPLVFDGSLLKRGKVTLSSLKNTVSFTIHLTDTSGQEFSYPLEIPIPLENKETGENIYSGNYMEENFLTDACFYY
ncbi:MAG: hypothetical protein HFJ32_05030 [Clostridia bacterium]|nr:hypothetical protein [Clostridia bacterium]